MPFVNKTHEAIFDFISSIIPGAEYRFLITHRCWGILAMVGSGLIAFHMRDPKIIVCTIPSNAIKHIEGHITWCYGTSEPEHSSILDISDPNLYDKILECLDGFKSVE